MTEIEHTFCYHWPPHIWRLERVPMLSSTQDSSETFDVPTIERPIQVRARMLMTTRIYRLQLKTAYVLAPRTTENTSDYAGIMKGNVVAHK